MSNPVYIYIQYMILKEYFVGNILIAHLFAYS